MNFNAIAQIRRALTNLIITLSSFFLFSCTNSSGGSNNGIAGTLQANWVSNCVAITSGTKMYEANHVSSTYTATTHYFTDSGCAALSLTVTETGSYTATAMNSDGTGNLNLTLGDLTLLPETISLANHYNSIGYCGYNDWIMSGPKSVLNRACGTVSAPVSGTNFYNIYHIEQPSGDPAHIGDLTFGVSSPGLNGSSPSLRYNTLSTSVFFKVQ